jgi:membrane protein YdbS with pleckstrin-like domain
LKRADVRQVNEHRISWAGSHLRAALSPAHNLAKQTRLAAVSQVCIRRMEQSIAETIADGVQRQLDPRWIPVQRILAAIPTVIVAGVSFVFVMSLWVGSGFLLLGLFLLPVWAVGMAAFAWQLQRWPAIAYRFSSYRIDEAGIEIRQGVYWRTITNVPRSRVQHTDVSQGPLERRFGLGTLVIYTAGTSHSRVNVSGLDFDVARRVRAHLLPDDQSDAV